MRDYYFNRIMNRVDDYVDAGVGYEEEESHSDVEHLAGEYDEGEETDDGQPQYQQQYQQPQQPVIGLDAVRALLEETRQQAPVQQPQMSQEEIDRALKTYRPTIQLAQRLFGQDATQEQVDALHEMVQGVVENASAINGYRAQALKQEIEGRYNPALEMVKEQKLTGFVGAIEGHYPSLKGKGHLIRQVTEHLRTQGYQPKNGEEAAHYVARQTEALIRSVNPQFNLGQAPQQPGGQQRQPQMAGLTAGRGGAAPSNGGNTKQKPKAAWQTIWD